MKTIRFCILGVLATLLAAAASAAEVAVIAHPSVPASLITSSELLDLYAGDVKEWRDGTPIIVFDLKPKSNIKDAFYKYLGKSSSRMKSIWMKNMLLGEGRPPQAHESEEDILNKVSTTPGAIGYINRNLVTSAVVELVIIPVETN